MLALGVGLVRGGLTSVSGATRTLVVMCPDWADDARAFEAVMAAVDSFTPLVEVIRPGLCAFATRGPSRYFGGDEKLAQAVGAAVDQVLSAIADGVTRCSVGVADGRFAAELAAGSGRCVRVVPRGGSRVFLAPQPIRSLSSESESGAELVDLLTRLGIRTLGHLAALPPAAVLARFGPTGVAVHRLARGLDTRPLVARTPPADLAVAAEIDPPTESVETAAFMARGLAERLHDGLVRRGLAAARVLVEAETEHGEHLSRIWRYPHTAAALAERVRWQLDGWLTARGGGTRPTGPLSLLRLTPEEVGPDDGRQEGFWGGDRAAAERAARALARVQGVLGPDAVVSAQLVGGRAPAEQVRLVPWGDARPSPPASSRSPSSPRSKPQPPWPGRVPPPAPATIHPVPMAAELLDAVGDMVMVSGRGAMSSSPTQLSIHPAGPVDVEAWAGPWPAEERWWDASSHRRRARCQLLITTGVAYLMVLEGGRWWVEATYD